MSKAVISSLQLPMDEYSSIAHWAQDMEEWVKKSKEDGAALVLFPEYGSLSLGSLLPEKDREVADDMMRAMQQFLPAFHSTFKDLAQRYDTIIVTSSFPVVEEDDAIYNRAFVYSPDGLQGHQDKLILTRFERERSSVKAGNNIKMFDAPFGRFAIAICFDSEFPVIVRKMVDADARVILVPSCTGSMAGFHRVRIGSQARALENQIPIVQSVTVGDAPWQTIANTNHGCAGFYSPPDNGFPADGIMTIGAPDVPCVVSMEIDFNAFSDIRSNGHVLNWSYWNEQDRQVKVA